MLVTIRLVHRIFLRSVQDVSPQCRRGAEIWQGLSLEAPIPMLVASVMGTTRTILALVTRVAVLLVGVDGGTTLPISLGLGTVACMVPLLILSLVTRQVDMVA